jgi:hypothetical protein
MGILPMSITGVPPVSLLLSLLCQKWIRKKQETTGKMPVRLMGETPMLR